MHHPMGKTVHEVVWLVSSKMCQKKVQIKGRTYLLLMGGITGYFNFLLVLFFCIFWVSLHWVSMHNLKKKSPPRIPYLLCTVTDSPLFEILLFFKLLRWPVDSPALGFFRTPSLIKPAHSFPCKNRSFHAISLLTWNALWRHFLNYNR